MYAARAECRSSPEGAATAPANVIRLVDSGSASLLGVTIERLARGSLAKLRPCSARFDTHSTGAPPTSPYATIDAQGSPSTVRVASVAALLAAAMVRACSAADG
jgi:hypothetical protein